ncbi:MULTISPECIES: RBBP9/YdeN family alpha/beta hydrolase [Rhodococcus]|uniref:Alpha/beta hydrolase n=1 Tax=Rhodococcus oxybenzonivorans TaxID=1990687 RepID=A0AAE5A8P4_9NOCA|nr:MULTISPECIES: alpha/beta hydrolase [Rhodococcus]MDV7243541.1 alpha/beta hydrolase [Rhodococcus oxybenzonivorans]MDV7267952.1 alpha/beta hydrolase [Rhodococcus oxybenzonivorans]MDV7277517.1 alpha/beta hydrolase [Rhodococcus oxybenzonivorans]MDV7335455.1 alpha/beta hydrolase [Rhodococcus oxybenzonivorans]MDV7347229.1 alpha/beta hydrolase [Rhodococcus oxybenzonivorans]
MTTSTSTTPTVVIVPGLRDHVADHWQTLLAERLDTVRTVPPLEQDKLSLAARVAALDAVLADIDGPVVLVAHSAGVAITVHWAQQSTRPIQGALLATPPDLEEPLPAGYPTPGELEQGGWDPVPRGRLPFPSVVAASTNDPMARFRRVAGMAESWGSKLVDLGAVGHLNPAAGYGYWPYAEELLRDLIESTVVPGLANADAR